MAGRLWPDEKGGATRPRKSFPPPPRGGTTRCQRIRDRRVGVIGMDGGVLGGGVADSLVVRMKTPCCGPQPLDLVKIISGVFSTPSPA